MDMKTMTEGLSVEDVEELVPSLETGKGKSELGGCSGYTLLALLGPHLAGPMMADGWFAADFAMAHRIYGNLPGEQTWMCAVNMLEEAVTGGPYFWGYPKHSRLQVLAKDDAPFYSLSTPRGLLQDFKEKLREIVGSLCARDRLLVLIFAHGDEEPDENGVQAGILVGEGDQEGFGVLYASELNSILSPCPARVTLITSACFGGAWHHESRTTYSGADKEETLSVPLSNSRAYRGGYFWEAMWYELSRLGLREPEKDVEESHKFKEGVIRVRDRLIDLMTFNPEPAISVASEEEWEHHFREVIQLNEFEDQSHLSFFTIPPNPNNQGGVSLTAALSSGGQTGAVSSGGQTGAVGSGGQTGAVSSEGQTGAVGSGGQTGAVSSAGAESSAGAGNVVWGSRVWRRQVPQGLQDSDMHALLSIGSDKETILPSYATPRNKKWVPGALSLHLRVCVIGLPALVDYFIHSMPGLHNLPSNIPTFMLLLKYWKMSATKEELEDLRRILQYRMVQDVKAEEMLSFLNIPRLCSITKFRMEHHQSKEQEPYLRVVQVAHVFDKAPKLSPPCRTYRKPMYYLANTAFRKKMDLVWWRESLEACHDYFEDFEQHFCKRK